MASSKLKPNETTGQPTVGWEKDDGVWSLTICGHICLVVFDKEEREWYAECSYGDSDTVLMSIRRKKRAAQTDIAQWAVSKSEKKT